MLDGLVPSPDMSYSERMRVTYADVDVMDHVNNAAYFTYMETARCHYYMRLKGLARAKELDIIVASQTCDYLRGLTYDELFDVFVWPSRIGTTSFTISYAMRTLDGELVARAETVLVAFDYSKNAKKPIDADVRAKLEADLKKGPGIALPDPQ
jgi:acyl-CoA thioester hydrolase